MSYSVVGTVKSGIWSSGSSFTITGVNPTAIGDVLVLWGGTRNLSTPSPSFNSLSHSGITTWNKLIARNDATPELDGEIWWGIVTATGSATLTVNLSGTPTLDGVALVLQFHSTNGSGWVADPVTAANTQTGTSGNYPSMTPTNAGELQLAGSRCPAARTMGGSTSGYTYAYLAGDGVQYIYNTSGPSPSAPAWTLDSSTSAIFLQGALYVPSTPSGFFTVL